MKAALFIKSIVMTKKIKLKDLKVKSFITVVSDQEIDSTLGGYISSNSIIGTTIRGTRWTDHDTRGGLMPRETDI